MGLMSCQCCQSLARYMTTCPLIMKKSFLNWRKSGIRRPNRTERNRLT